MIWFINNNSASCLTLAAGCGRLTNPFSTLAAFNALNNGTGNNPAANDNIFVYESATAYIGPLTLVNGQKFIGQDATATLSSISGVTPPAGSDPLPAKPRRNDRQHDERRQSELLSLKTIPSVDSPAGMQEQISVAPNFGTLNISDVTLNGSGQALSLTTGTLAATFGSISSTDSGATAINLITVAGSMTSGGTVITNPSGSGISINTSSGAFSFANTLVTGSSTVGVLLTTNTGAITFADLDIAPDGGQRGLLLRTTRKQSRQQAARSPQLPGQPLKSLVREAIHHWQWC